MNINEKSSFKQIAALRVPGKIDRYSQMSYSQLLDYLGDRGEETLEKILNIWAERNQTDKDKNYCLTEKEITAVFRWCLRGLSLDLAIKKVRIDYEINLCAQFSPKKKSSADAIQLSLFAQEPTVTSTQPISDIEHLDNWSIPDWFWNVVEQLDNCHTKTDFLNVIKFIRQKVPATHLKEVLKKVLKVTKPSRRETLQEWGAAEIKNIKNSWNQYS